HQPVAHFRRSGGHDSRRIVPDGKNKALVPGLVPQLPQSDLIAPCTPEVLALDAQSAVVCAVHVDLGARSQVNLAQRAVPTPRSHSWPQNSQQTRLGSLHTRIPPVSKGRSDDGV